MDAITHAFSAGLLMIATGNEPYIAFCIAGSVIPDIDFLFRRFSDPHPARYIFVHGGITHSLTGAATVSVMAGLVILTLSGTGFLHLAVPAAAAFGFILLGAWLHVFLDFLASPGIPVLYLATERKYSAGIFAGPSMVLMAASLVFLAMIAITGPPTTAMWTVYGIFFVIFIALSAGVRAAAGMRARTEAGNPGYTTIRGTTVLPTLHPFRWIAIADCGENWRVRLTDLAGHVHSEREFDKHRGFSGDVAAAEAVAERLRALPEVRRVYFNSYLVAVERTEEGVAFFDPLREAGVAWYPPYYARVGVRLD